MRALGLAAALLVVPGVAGAQSSEVPKANLQLLVGVIRAVRELHVSTAGDAQLAADCAAAARAAAVLPGTGEPFAALGHIPAMLQALKAKADAAITYHTLAAGCARGMLAGLGTRSSFIDEVEFRELQVGRNVAALGLELRKEGDAIVVARVIEGGPAERAGIAPGERLLQADGERLTGASLPSAVTRLRGTPGSEVALTLDRPGGEPRDLSLRREIVRPTLVWLDWLEGDVLSIRMRQFSEGSEDALVGELESAIEPREPRGLLLDLRDNTGGLLYGAVNLAALFLPDEALVGTTRGRAQGSEESYRAGEYAARRRFRQPSERLRAVLRHKPMAVLVNAGTSSGGEMAAAALQAHGRAVLVGVPTSGIGSIQAIVPMPGKNALRLTTAYWFSPREHRIEGNPLQPDVQVEAQGGSPVKLIDPQRQAALELLRAKASGG